MVILENKNNEKGAGTCIVWINIFGYFCREAGKVPHAESFFSNGLLATTRFNGDLTGPRNDILQMYLVLCSSICVLLNVYFSKAQQLWTRPEKYHLRAQKQQRQAGVMISVVIM